MSCPNKSLQSYKDLVNEFGEAKALVVFKLNNDEIPSIEKARQLLGKNLSPVNLRGHQNWGYIENNDGYYVKKNLYTTNVLSVLDQIIQGSTDPESSKLAEILARYNIKKIKLEYYDKIPDSDAYGDYSADTHVIRIKNNLKSPIFETVFLHELVHAITFNAYTHDLVFQRKINDLYTYTSKYFLNKITENGGRFGYMYGMTDVYEFMTEALTNPDFIKELSKISSPFKESSNKNIFEEFIDLILKVLNVSSKEYRDSMHNTLVNVINNYASIEDYNMQKYQDSYQEFAYAKYPQRYRDINNKAALEYKYTREEKVDQYRAERIADAIRTNPQYSGWYAELTPFTDEQTDKSYYTISILPTYGEDFVKQMDKDTSKESVNTFLDSLLGKFEGVNYLWIKPSDLKQTEHVYNINSINAFTRGKTIYLVEGRVSRSTALEELLHPFVEGLYQDNTALFNSLHDEMLKLNPEYAKSINDYYSKNPSVNKQDVRKEIVTRFLKQAVVDELATNEEKSLSHLKQLLEKFFNWLKQTIEDVFGANFSRYQIKASDIPRFVKVEDLASIINTQGIQLQTAYINSPAYNLSELDEDEKVFGSRQRNIDRVQTQIDLLDDVMSKLINDDDVKKIETLSAMKDKLESHLQDIIDGKNTVSVTKLKGGGALDLFNQSSKFQNFGTFLHDALERLQKDYLNDDSILPSRRLSEEFLNEQLERELDKDFNARFTIETGASSDITNINKKEVLDMMRALLQPYEAFIVQGYTIIPEITVVGTDKANRTVIGRIDSLAIGRDGSVHIIDLKTKKLYNETSWLKIQAQLERTYRVEASADSDADFFLTPQMANRSAYQEWDIQLGIYEQLFKQMGINVASKQILALTYMGENEYVPMPDSLSNAIDFRYKSYMVVTHYSTRESYDSVSDKLIFDKYQETVKKVIPVQEKSLEEKKKAANIIFNLTDEQKNNIISRINSVIDTEIGKTSATIRSYREKGLGESEMVKALSEKAETLKKVRDTMNKENWDTAYKLSLTLQFLDESYDSLNKTITEIKKLDNDQERALQLDALRRRASGLNYFIDELEKTLISVDPSLNKQAISTIGRIKSNMQSVLIAYNELGADFMIKIIASMDGKRRQTVMSKEREESIKPRLEYLKKKLERLKKGNPTLGDLGGKISYTFMGGIKNMIRGLQNIPGQELNEIKNIELQIKSLELELEGIKLEPAEIKKYVEGVLEDNNSLLYLGKGVTVISDVIASAGNSDLGISSFTNFLKVAQQEAQKEYVNFIERIKFQKELDEFGQGETDMTALSRRITEVRKIKEKDEEGNKVEKEVLSLLDPVQQEWRDAFEKYWDDLKVANEEVRNAGNEVDRKAAVKRKSEIIEKHRAFSLQHSQMPLKKEVYELENLLPAEYRLARKEILDEINVIRSRAGYNNEELLTDEDRNDIAELEADLQRLKVELLKEGVRYSDYIAQLDKYYSFETNWNFFNRIRNSKIIQYGENSEEFRKWEAENTIKTPNELYYDELEEIYEEMFSIVDKDDELDDLRKQQREILSKVRRRGYADVRFLTDEEKNDYMVFEAMMQELKEEKVREQLDQDDYKRLQELRNRLNSIRTFTTNPYYQMEYSSKKQALDQVYALYKQAEEILASDDSAQAKANFNNALNAFYYEEESFEEWYNKNHYDLYESRLIADKPLNPKPLPFNVISLPTNQKHFDTKPISKYSIRKLKEEAKNPDYQEDVYGIPLPKALKRDDATGVISVVDQSSQWVNPSYKLLTKNDRDFKFYNFLVTQFIKTQGETYGNTLGYLVPGYEEVSLKNYQEKGIKEGAKENFNLWKQKNFQVNNPYAHDVNEYATDVERIRFKHNRPLPINEQSRNAIGCVLKWYEEAFINKNLGQIQPQVNAALSYLEGIYSQLENSNVPDKELRKNELQKTISVMRAEYNKIIKGETKLDQGALSRVGDLVLRGLGMARMGLDIPNQIGNLFSGNVQIFLGGHKTGQYNNQNLIQAKKNIWKRNGLMNSLVDDISKISGKSHMTNMYLYFNPMQQMIEDNIDKTMSRGDRVKQSILDLEFAFWVQDKGEIEIASTIWLSMMDNRKVKLTKDDGTTEIIPLLEAYESNADGEIVIRKGVEWTKADENEFFRNMYSEIRRTQGNYAAIDKTKAEQGILGRYGMFFRKYLLPSIQNRFGSRRENHEGSEIAMGYYNAFFQAIRYYGMKDVLLSLFSKNTKVSPFYRQRAIWAAREVAVGIALTLLGNAIASMVSSWGDDDDDISIRKVLLYNAIAVFLKVERETRGLIPLPGIGGFEGYLTQLSSFTNAGSDFVKVGKLVAHAGGLALAQIPVIGDNEYLQKAAYYQANSGYWEEGDAKIRKDIMDVSAVTNVYDIFHPVSLQKRAIGRR